MPLAPGECATCGGFGPWRPKGHADWCEEVKAWLRRPHRPEPRPDHGTVDRYLAGCNCLRCHRAWIDHHRLEAVEDEDDL